MRPTWARCDRGCPSRSPSMRTRIASSRAMSPPAAGGDGSKLHAAEPSKGSRSAGGSTTSSAGGSYIVFVRRGGKIVPASIQTGLTDLDYIEVTSGLTEQDTVVVLSGSGAR